MRSESDLNYTSSHKCFIPLIFGQTRLPILYSLITMKPDEIYFPSWIFIPSVPTPLCAATTLQASESTRATCSNIILHKPEQQKIISPHFYSPAKNTWCKNVQMVLANKEGKAGELKTSAALVDHD